MSATPDISLPDRTTPGAPGAVPPSADAAAHAPAAAATPAPAVANATRPERWPKIVLIVALALLAGFVSYAVTAARTSPPPVVTPSTLSVLPRGSVAPDFSLPRLGGGPPVRLVAFRGRPTVVNFFASWCPDCRAELGAFGAVSRATRGAVNFVGVDANDTNPGLARRLLAQAGASYPVGTDPNGTVTSTKYVSTHLPVTFFLDARGRVVGEAYGAQSRSGLLHWVAILAPGRPAGT